MTDFQRKKLFTAEADVWLRGDRHLHPVLTNEEVLELVDEFSSTRGSGVITVEFDDIGKTLSLTGSILIVPAWAQRPQMLIHELTHDITPPEFPSHGAEFAETLLETLHTYGSPALADAVREAFDARGVHYDAERRKRRVKRQLVNAANQEPGVMVELILADPPEIVTGNVLGLERNILEIDERLIDIDRGRYVRLYR